MKKKNRLVYGFLGKEATSGRLNKDKVIKVFNNLPVTSGAFMEQVHGDQIQEVGSTKGLGFIEQTDGILTEDSSFVLIGSFADCVPVYFYTEDLQVIGLVHSGWKSTQLRIVPKMLKALEDRQIPMEKIRVIIGPSISRDHYEVGQEFYDYFPQSKAFSQKEDKLFFHVALEVYHQLEEKLKPQQILWDKRCSYEDQSLHSHRREGIKAGRNLAYIYKE